MISIITPVYNGERFIESCIKVVIEQNCPNVEHIIVDGSSTDGTVDIIKQYAEKYSHIRWISEKDKGQSDAMNKGIAMAKGEILAILNVDDYYEPDVLNRVTEIFKTLPNPSLLVGNCNILDGEGNLLYLNKPKKIKFVDLLLGTAANPFPENPSSYFYHTLLHEKIGLYNIDEQYAMDLDFLLRAVQVAKTKYVNETWGNFQRLEGTKTFESLKTGECQANTDRLINKYHKCLPLPQRWIVSIGYKFFKKVDWSRYKYFLDEPKNIFIILNKKMKKYFTSTAST